jgi:hypothetical protein
MRLDSNFEGCELVETIERLLCKCEKYSELLCRLGDIIIQHMSTEAEVLILRVELGHYDVIPTSLICHCCYIGGAKFPQSVLLIPTQEIKRRLRICW